MEDEPRNEMKLVHKIMYRFIYSYIYIYTESGHVALSDVIKEEIEREREMGINVHLINDWPPLSNVFGLLSYTQSLASKKSEHS